MENIFASKLEIESVGNLKNIEIPLSQVEKKHLILTGKNGSGKTRVLQAISSYLNVLVTSDSIVESEEYLIYYENKIQQMIEEGIQNQDLEEARLGVEQYIEKLRTLKSGISMQFNQLIDTIQEAFEQGNYVMAYYGANRAFEAEVPKYVEKIELKENYFITESPRQLFIKYLLDLKVTEALARNNDKVAKADKIKKWFGKLEKLLREIFDDKSLMLVFDDDLYAFLIKMDGQEAFDFNSLSSGFAAILDIVFDIILRME